MNVDYIKRRLEKLENEKTEEEKRPNFNNMQKKSEELPFKKPEKPVKITISQERLKELLEETKKIEKNLSEI